MTPEALRAFRRAHGWTQAELGARVGYSAGAIAAMETGRRRVALRLQLMLEPLGGPAVARGGLPLYAHAKGEGEAGR